MPFPGERPELLQPNFPESWHHICDKKLFLSIAREESALRCPACEAEKLDEDLCPQCLLGQRQALLKAADLHWREKRPGPAIENYGKYLDLEPHDFEVAVKLVGCLCADALERNEAGLYREVDKAIVRLLDTHWYWLTGHRYRIQLYSRLGILNALLKEYDEAHSLNPHRARVSEKVVQTIRRVVQFNQVCPSCKKEKWNQDICPHCGLGEKEALLRMADLYWREEENGPAIDLYDKYLVLEPDDIDVAFKRAGCLCAEAFSRRSRSLFQKADQEILRILENHWDWQTGHRYRIDLYSRFGDLRILIKEYDKVHRRHASREPSCDKIIRNITLVTHFKEDPPLVHRSLDDLGEAVLLWRSFWPLILGLLGFWIVSRGFSSLMELHRPDMAKKIFLLQSLLSMAMLGLFLWGVANYRKIKKNTLLKTPKMKKSR